MVQGLVGWFYWIIDFQSIRFTAWNFIQICSTFWVVKKPLNP